MKSTGKLSKDMDMPMISPLVCLLERTLAQRLQKLRALKTGLRLNFSKTWEILLYRRTSELAPPPVPGIQRKECLKLSGITFHEDPSNWDLHIDSFLSRAASRLYILRVCKYYGYTKDQLSVLFESLIMSLFLYGLEVWCSASQGKYLDRIDIFIRRPCRFGFTDKVILISEVIKNRDRDLLNRITSDTDHVLYDMFTRYPLPCERRFLAGMAFSINEVVDLACPSRSWFDVQLRDCERRKRLRKC